MPEHPIVLNNEQIGAMLTTASLLHGMGYTEGIGEHARIGETAIAAILKSGRIGIRCVNCSQVVERLCRRCPHCQTESPGRDAGRDGG